MKPIIKINLDAKINSHEPMILELGSGNKKPDHSRVYIDRLELPGVDIIANLEDGLPFLPDNSVDAIYSNSFLEHINNLEFLMYEIWRVLKPNGQKYVFVPHFSNPYYYSDYAHHRFFGLYSFEYFSKSQTSYKRKVPDFYHQFSFHTEKLTLVFNSPWRTRKIIKKFAQKIFNINNKWQEFYEENLCYLIPCYGIQAILKPEK